MSSPFRIPVLARRSATSPISGSAAVALSMSRRTSLAEGANGFERVERGRTASRQGFESIMPRFQECSSARLSTVPHRHTQSGPRPLARIAA